MWAYDTNKIFNGQDMNTLLLVIKLNIQTYLLFHLDDLLWFQVNFMLFLLWWPRQYKKPIFHHHLFDVVYPIWIIV